MRPMVRTRAVGTALLGFELGPAADQSDQRYSTTELLNAGHQFFGTISQGLACVIERAVSQWGQPNGYILGEEAGGAFVGGLRYGDGTLYTKNAGDLQVFWQGPSIGLDWGGDGARTMMLVYNLPRTDAIFAEIWIDSIGVHSHQLAPERVSAVG